MFFNYALKSKCDVFGRDRFRSSSPASRKRLPYPTLPPMN